MLALICKWGLQQCGSLHLHFALIYWVCYSSRAQWLLQSKFQSLHNIIKGALRGFWITFSATHQNTCFLRPYKHVASISFQRKTHIFRIWNDEVSDWTYIRAVVFHRKCLNPKPPHILFTCLFACSLPLSCLCQPHCCISWYVVSQWNSVEWLVVMCFALQVSSQTTHGMGTCW